jgi:mannose-1-phosphate guanylyltransferase/mannose-6-phosphate isomerase
VVVSTDDALLVAARSELGSLKGVVESMLEADRAEAPNQSRVVRPWGARNCVERGDGFQIKHITIRSGEALSLQYHTHRSKHWIVVRGQAIVTCDGKSFCLNENESTFIPKDAVHRLKNNGTEMLELVEVQCGTYPGEEGIREPQPFRDDKT